MTQTHAIAVVDTMEGRQEIPFVTVEESEVFFAWRTPGTDGAIVPQLSIVEATTQAMRSRGYEYSRGEYWHGNLYAITYTRIPEGEEGYLSL